MCGVAIPSGFKKAGVPLGVSLIAPAGCEANLLEIGDALHQKLGIKPGKGS
jgi:Asp-tRNA(Asn)/Glu-tRNA(Gln) amidotransferase A subunit family amidase